MNLVIDSKQDSYIGALTDCASRQSKIATISEMEKYWKYAEKHHFNFGSACQNHACEYFWTSDKPINSSHSISGTEIHKIFLSDDSLMEKPRIPVASFETLELTTSPDPDITHLCICILYEPRTVPYYISKISNLFSILST